MPVDKKNGEKRLALVYRRLKARTVKVKYPLPNIHGLSEGLATETLYAALHLLYGYLQVPLTEEAKETKNCVHHFRQNGVSEKLVFRLTNAPGIFQRLTYRVLGLLRGEVALVIEEK